MLLLLESRIFVLLLPFNSLTWISPQDPFYLKKLNSLSWSSNYLALLLKMCNLMLLLRKKNTFLVNSSLALEFVVLLLLSGFPWLCLHVMHIVQEVLSHVSNVSFVQRWQCQKLHQSKFIKMPIPLLEFPFFSIVWSNLEAKVEQIGVFLYSSITRDPICHLPSSRDRFLHCIAKKLAFWGTNLPCFIKDLSTAQYEIGQLVNGTA